MSYTSNHYIEANAVQRVASLPLFDSALKSVVSVYTDVKGRYPLLGVVGGVAEIGVRNVSQAAILRATPLLLSLEPQIEVVNNYACMGLDQLEKNFPVLHQSTEEVLGHLKDAFFLILDDVQLRVNDELDGMQGRWDKLTDATWYYLLALQESQLGQMATSGLDDILTRSEEAMAKYLPLTATLRLEWERRTQQYEDEDGEDEPGLWMRFRGLLLCLSLQLYHRLLKLRNRLERAMGMLQDATDRMGLSRLLEVVGSVLQRLQLLYVSQVLPLEAVRRLALDQLKAQVQVLAELGPVKQLLGLPAPVQLVVADLQELGKILLQLLVNSTPLYNMLQQPSDQDVEDFLNQQESMSSDTTRRSSANSLFLKAMDGRPHKRTSSYARSQRGSTSAPSPASAKSPNGSRGSQKQDDQTLSLELKNLDLPSTIAVCCRSSVRRGSSSGINPPDPSPVPDPAPANPVNDDDQPLSRQGSQKPDDQPLSRQGSQKPDDQPLSLELDPLELPSTSTVRHPSSAAEVLLGSILQYISSEPPSDEPVVPEVETTKNHTEARDESPPRYKSLSVRSRRSSSGAGNPSNVRQGSQMRNDEPLSVEFDILEVSSTSALRRRSLAAEVLLGPILQYLSSEPSSDETVIPEVETTEKNAHARDESPPRHQSLSPRSRRSSSNAVVPELETTEYYFDERNGSPLRRKSLSIHSRRSSSSGGNAPGPGLTPDNPHNGRQMQDSLEELDTLALHSTSAVRRRSWAVEVLLDPILQYLNPGHSEKSDIEEAEIPVVEGTEH
uniref:Perilipin 6 n=1 Tax=Hucho hucho TaxID=62062 RepID=A0A4W5QYI8_9TELE